MAANKFATMVHKNTNQLTLVLVYVLLEWTLIFMLLLNALFSYLILKFSQFFGLKSPCIFCSRIDHVLDPKKKNFNTDLLCEAHVSEISKLGICSSENCAKLDVKRDHFETIRDTQKRNLVIELDRVKKSDEFEEIELGGEVARVDCSVSETNLGVREKETFEEAIENLSCSDNRTETEIEECGDKNLDKFAVFECLEMKANECNPHFFQTKTCDFVSQQRESNSLAGEAYQMPLNESEDDVSIGTEIPDIEATYAFHHQEACVKKDDHGMKQVEEDVVELKTISMDAMNHPFTLDLELNEIIEEKVPNTPSSIESLHHLYKNLLLLEKKDSGTVESFDGSVTSEFEEGDTLSIEHLKSTLKSERKALNDLYTELEEERSANAIAANQTMAMINRLQEEKAAMQMEALHYQRMMEEQSQFDQEALEFLNDLITKREMEKQELGKELEVYRKRVFEYEGKGILKKAGKESESASFSSSNWGDSDGLSVDLNREDSEKEDQNTPAEAILRLDDLSADEEKLLILHQLKLLEEKLYAKADDDEEEEEHFKAVESIDHIDKENGNHMEKHKEEMNGKHEIGKRIMGMKAKRLLPLFQATENEHVAENGHTNGSPDRSQNSISENIEFENRNLDIEEEYDRLYERLQALEADKEFPYLRQ